MHGKTRTQGTNSGCSWIKQSAPIKAKIQSNLWREGKGILLFPLSCEEPGKRRPFSFVLKIALK